MAYSLSTDGDAYEQKYYQAFIGSEFTSYNSFWVKHIVPITNRPMDIHFKSNAQLAAVGKTDQDICIAQLHYTVLRHLARVYDIRQQGQVSIDDLTEGIVRLVGAQDVAFELLERYRNPGSYDPWLAVAAGRTKGSREARQAWQRFDSNPLQNIRYYRNHLVHGRVSPSVSLSGALFVPKIGKEDRYFDWRVVTQHPNPTSLVGTDLVGLKDVLENAWNSTLQYFEARWQTYLI